MTFDPYRAAAQAHANGDTRALHQLFPDNLRIPAPVIDRVASLTGADRRTETAEPDQPAPAWCRNALATWAGTRKKAEAA